MKDFFTFYKDISSMDLPFTAFSFIHIAFVLVTFFIVAILYHNYNRLQENQKRRYLVGMAIFYIVEESLYTLWLLIMCHDDVLHQILPLELCSLCAYINALTVFVRKDYLRFFSGVIGLVAGLVAMLYPANISGLYPVLSYRTFNFYLLHGSFILFSLIQLKDIRLLQYCYLKKNYLIMCCMFTSAFVVNLMMHTQYMFVGTPPELGIIASIYQITGIVFFLPAVLIILGLLQFLILYILRKIFRVKEKLQQDTFYVYRGYKR